MLATVLGLCGSWTVGADDLVALLTRDRVIDEARLVAIGEHTIEIREPGGDRRIIPIDECIGFINYSVAIQPLRTGVVALVDGQRFPGELIPDNRSDSTRIAWDHRWLGTMRLGLDDIDWIGFDRTAERPAVRETDVVVLSNGDRIEGFINEVGRVLRMEMEPGGEQPRGESTVEIDRDRIHALRLVNPSRAPAAGARRVWLNNGTVFDVSSIRLGDDGAMRLEPMVESQMRDLPLSLTAGVLFDPAALVPLASLEPHDVIGPPVRYTVPRPEISHREHALGLRTVILRGPLTVRYTLVRRSDAMQTGRPGDPGSAREARPAMRFVATVRLLNEHSPWPDCEFIILDDDREALRIHLNPEQPEADVDVVLHGSELSLIITEGRHGPVQDHLVIEGGMILRGTRE